MRTVTLIGVALVAFAAKPAVTPPKLFPTPEAAAEALVSAARVAGDQAVLEVLGSDASDLVNSGDEVADRNLRDDFLKGYEAKHGFEREGDAKAVLVIGEDDYPFAIPLVKAGEQWHFDPQAGRDEILARRVGRNELAAIQVCLAYVDAQREYAAIDRDGDGLYEYAQHFLSAKGKQDGLYWPTEPGEPDSPLGELIGDARAEGYRGEQGKPTPYHGYFYKILTKQGPHADGGAYDYLVRGRMIGGFAMLAYPAEYGTSGITTFVVNHDGVVFSKDLGEDTAKLGKAMTSFDPDSTWQKEE
jgi:hypothetical protein